MRPETMAAGVALFFLAAAAGAAAAGPPPPGQRYRPPAHAAQLVTMRAADGVRLDAALVGSGPRGVALVHETGPRALCGWWPYAVRLAGRGFHVLLFDLRCAGLSGCPAGGGGDTAADVAAAAAELRGRGCRSIELVGASSGGSVAGFLRAHARPDRSRGAGSR